MTGGGASGTRTRIARLPASRPAFGRTPRGPGRNRTFFRGVGIRVATFAQTQGPRTDDHAAEAAKHVHGPAPRTGLAPVSRRRQRRCDTRRITRHCFALQVSPSGVEPLASRLGNARRRPAGRGDGVLDGDRTRLRRVTAGPHHQTSTSTTRLGPVRRAVPSGSGVVVQNPTYFAARLAQRLPARVTTGGLARVRPRERSGWVESNHRYLLPKQVCDRQTLHPGQSAGNRTPSSGPPARRATIEHCALVHRHGIEPRSLRLQRSATTRLALGAFVTIDPRRRRHPTSFWSPCRLPRALERVGR